MTSSILTRTYIARFIKNWLLSSFILVFFESLLHYLRESQLITDSYTHAFVLHYLSIEFFHRLVELAPLTIYLACVLTNWQWSMKGLWLTSWVIGTSRKQLLKLLAIQVCFVSLILLPCKFFITDPLSAQASLSRLKLLERLPSVKNKEIYVDQQRLFYPLSDDRVFVYEFDTKTQSTQTYVLVDQEYLETSGGSLDLSWILKRKVGLDKISLPQKITSLSSVPSWLKREMNISIMKDINYIFLLSLSLLLAWRASPPQALKRQRHFSSLRFLCSALLLYAGLKFFSIAALIMETSYVLLLFWVSAFFTLLTTKDEIKQFDP